LILSSEKLLGPIFYKLLADLLDRPISLWEFPTEPLFCSALLSDLFESSNSIKLVFWVYFSVPTLLLFIGDKNSLRRDGLNGFDGVLDPSSLDN
jgi:hypothetical protein